MIDFTGLPIREKTYSGANGSKISVVGLWFGSTGLFKSSAQMPNFVSI